MRRESAEGSCVQDPDPRTVARAQGGDLRAFEDLVRQFQADVFRFAWHLTRNRTLAEDVTQDAFLKAYRARGRYRPTGHVEAWLCTIAAREAISRLRWATLQKRLLDRGRRHVEQSALPTGLVDRLDELLAALSPKQRALVVLHFLHGYRYREIAVMLRLPEGTVASRLSHAMALMRERARRPDESGAGERWTRQRQ